MDINKYITVAYKLYTIENGDKELIEEAKIEHPFQFISGLGATLDEFEYRIVNLKKGDAFDFIISSSDAFGDFHEDHIIDLPKSTFEVNGKFDAKGIKEGVIVPLMDSEGRRLNGTVMEIKEDVVVLDMNHPLAGADLNFVGEVIENRDATTEEVQDMINLMSEDSKGGCEGCGDGGCGDGGCNGCEH